MPLRNKIVFRNRKRLTQRRNWGRAWIRCLLFLPGPWLLIDRQKKTIIDGSRHMGAILECDRAYFMGQHVSRVSGKTIPDDWTSKPFDDQTIERPGRYEDVALKKADGTKVTVDVHVSHPPRYGQRPVAICLITDRTEQSRLQHELISKHQELRKAFAELETRSHRLRETREALQTTNRELGQMSAKLSRASELAAIGEITAELTHQLNNPLAAGVGATRRLEKLVRSSQEPAPKMLSMIDLLKNSLDRLTNTVSELRRVYITSRPVDGTVESFSLKAQVDRALALLEERLESRKILTDFPDSMPLIQGRPSQLQHVLVNLLDNAAEAAGPGGTLSMNAAISGNKLELSIGDSGAGIPSELREKVFEPFYTTKEKGTGLGLAVVRRNLENDGAKVCVGESPLGGAQFTVVLQVAE